MYIELVSSQMLQLLLLMSHLGIRISEFLYFMNLESLNLIIFDKNISNTY